MVHRDSDGLFQRESYFIPNTSQDFYYAYQQEEVWAQTGIPFLRTPYWTVDSKDSLTLLFRGIDRKIPFTSDTLQTGLYPICWFGRLYANPYYIMLYSNIGQYPFQFGMQYFDTYYQPVQFEMYKNGRLEKKGNLEDWDRFGNFGGCYAYYSEEANYVLKLSMEGLKFRQTTGTATLYAKFSSRTNSYYDYDLPFIEYLQIRSGGKNVDAVDPRQPNNHILLKVTDDQQIDMVNVYYRTPQDSNWCKMNPVLKNDQYRVDIPPNLPYGMISLRIQFKDKAGHEIDYRAEPAFKVGMEEMASAYEMDVSPPYSRPGGTVHIRAKTYKPQFIDRLTAHINSNGHTIAQVPLYDDGAHGDGAPGDAMFANDWTCTSEKQDYAIDVVIDDVERVSYSFPNLAQFSTRDRPFMQIEKVNIVLEWDSDKSWNAYVAGDKDQELDPGERIGFNFAIRNIGTISAQDVSVSITPLDANSELCQDITRACGSIEPDQVIMSDNQSGDFLISAKRTASSGDSVRIKVLFKDANGNENDDIVTFRIRDTLGPWIDQMTLDDQTLAPLQEVNISLEAFDASGIESIIAYFKDGYSETIVDSLPLTRYQRPTLIDTLTNVFSGKWTLPVTPANYHTSFRTRDMLGNVRYYADFRNACFSSLAIDGKRKMLLVLDNHTLTNYSSASFLSNFLDDCGYTYDLWDCYFRGKPNYNDLAWYQSGIVVWTTNLGGYLDSRAQTGPDSGEEMRASVSRYLDAGGRLFITSTHLAPNIGHGYDNPAFMEKYLHARYVKDHVFINRLTGVATHPISDGLTIDLSDIGGAYATEIDPIPPAQSFLFFAKTTSSQQTANPENSHFGSYLGTCTSLDSYVSEQAVVQSSPPGTISSGTAGLCYDSGVFKLVFLPFWAGWISDDVQKKILLRNIIEWLLPFSTTMRFDLRPAGWQMISLPGTAADNRVDALFPDAAGGMAWTWDPVIKQYSVVFNSSKGTGYWIFLRRQLSTNLVVVNPNDKIHHIAAAGWQLLGFMQNVPVAELTTEPEGCLLSPIYGWSPSLQKYIQVDTLKTGQAYWLPVLAECDLLVQSDFFEEPLHKSMSKLFEEKFGSMPPGLPEIDIAEAKQIPATYALYQNYPNPFNQSTMMSYDVPADAIVDIVVWDITGRKVKSLVQGTKSAGAHQVAWFGEDEREQKVASGLYFVSMKSNDFFSVRKLIVIK